MRGGSLRRPHGRSGIIQQASGRNNSSSADSGRVFGPEAAFCSPGGAENSVWMAPSQTDGDVGFPGWKCSRELYSMEKFRHGIELADYSVVYNLLSMQILRAYP